MFLIGRGPTTKRPAAASYMQHWRRRNNAANPNDHRWRSPLSHGFTRRPLSLRVFLARTARKDHRECETEPRITLGTLTNARFSYTLVKALIILLIIQFEEGKFPQEKFLKLKEDGPSVVQLMAPSFQVSFYIFKSRFCF